MEKMLSWLVPVVMSLCLTGLLGCFKAPPTEPQTETARKAEKAEPTEPQTETEGKVEKRPPSGGGSASGMVEVPAGKFQRGDDDGYDEKPAREIYLDVFWIDVYEVTVDEYAKCVREGGCSAPKESHSFMSNFNWKASGRGKHPINGVDWDQAVAYCKWAGKRLPTEAEWEKAARGTNGREYPWGNEGADCSRAVMSDGGDGCGRDGTWEVGSKPSGVSPYGVHDMAGNVEEWTSDWYGENYYASAPGRNPLGPKSGSNRVLRGGSFINASKLRAAYRNSYSPSYSNFNVGFRCARSN